MKVKLFKSFIACISLLHALSAKADTEGPNSNSSQGSASNGTSIDWSSVVNISASDNSYATVSLNKNDLSYYIKATDFSFAIPALSTITGIVAEIERSIGAGSGNMVDISVKIIKNGNIQGTDHANAANWTGTDTYQTYGTSTDLWGLTWTLADINTTTFGVALSVKKTGNGSLIAQVDHIRMTVYYSISLPVTWLDVSADYKDSYAEIKWATASENNSDYFTVEKACSNFSGSQLMWNAIGTLNGAGSSTSPQRYAYMDDKPFSSGSPGHLYYRIRQTDLDGRSTYSSSVALYISAAAQFIAVYPSLARQDFVTIEFTGCENQPSTVFLFDIKGNAIRRNDYVICCEYEQVIYTMPQGLSFTTYYLDIASGSYSKIQKIILSSQ